MLIGSGLGNIDLGTLPHLLAPSDDGAIVADLRRASFISPVGLVLIASAVDRAKRENRAFVLHRPADDHVARYCSRMGLGQRLEVAGFENPLPSVYPNDPNFRFVALHECSGPEDEVLEFLGNRLESWGDRTLATRMNNDICELIFNVNEHAEAPGWVAAQCYPQKELVRLAVGDSGVGILASLRSVNGQFDTDDEAIRAACTTRISRKGSGGGFGLPGIVRVTTGDHKGTMAVLSGTSTLSFAGRQVRSTSTIPTPWVGTIVGVQFPYR